MNVVITSEYFGKFSDEGEMVLKKAGFNVIRNSYKKFLCEEEVIFIVGDADAIKISTNMWIMG